MQDREFKLNPSRLSILLMMTILLVSLIIALSLPISIGLKGLGMVFIMLYGIAIIWQFGLLRSRRSIIAIKHHQDGRWQLFMRDTCHEAVLRGDSTVTGLVSVLRFQVPKHARPKSCLIFRDSLGFDLYRQLLVILKMG